jgi:hypothetical protein
MKPTHVGFMRLSDNAMNSTLFHYLSQKIVSRETFCAKFGTFRSFSVKKIC